MGHNGMSPEGVTCCSWVWSESSCTELSGPMSAAVRIGPFRYWMSDGR
jgi:hypothetical protein